MTNRKTWSVTGATDSRSQEKKSSLQLLTDNGKVISRTDVNGTTAATFGRDSTVLYFRPILTQADETALRAGNVLQDKRVSGTAHHFEMPYSRTKKLS